MFVSKLSISINGNSLEFEGNLPLEQVLTLLAQWFRALPDGQDQERLDALTEKLKSQNDGLLSVVTGAQERA